MTCYIYFNFYSFTSIVAFQLFRVWLYNHFSDFVVVEISLNFFQVRLRSTNKNYLIYVFNMFSIELGQSSKLQEIRSSETFLVADLSKVLQRKRDNYNDFSAEYKVFIIITTLTCILLYTSFIVLIHFILSNCWIMLNTHTLKMIIIINFLIIVQCHSW